MTDLKVSQIKPLAGYVLIEPQKAETKTTSGIYLPESSDKKPTMGKVLACGDATVVDGREVKCPVSKGAQVLYKQWGGTDVEVGDITYQLMKFEDVIATVGK
jgi:chaperonin GroES